MKIEIEIPSNFGVKTTQAAKFVVAAIQEKFSSIGDLMEIVDEKDKTKNDDLFSALILNDLEDDGVE